MSPYAKWIVTIVMVILAVANHYAGPDSFVSYLILSVANSLGVFAVPNSVPGTVVRRVE